MPAHPTRPPVVSKTRSRDRALALLLPKFIGVLWERGQLSERPGSVKALIGDDLELGASEIVHGGYAISAYLLLPDSRATKVLSAHVAASRAVIDGLWPYWGGLCSILSWKRGAWEDRIVAEQVQPRTVAHLLYAGLIRSKDS